MSETVEIIVGCHKQERWIDSALFSAKNQVRPDVRCGHWLADRSMTMPEFSVRVNHDGCEERSTPLGASVGRNKAIEESSADWVLWLDADDMLPSHFLYSLWYLKTLTEGMKRIIAAPVQFIEGARFDYIKACYLQHMSDNPDHQHMRYPMCMSAMFPKKAWKEVGGLDPEMPGSEDLDFWVRCGYTGYQYFFSDNTFTLRRNVPGSRIEKNSASDREQLILDTFNRKHGTRLVGSRLLPYKVPMSYEL